MRNATSSLLFFPLLVAFVPAQDILGVAWGGNVYRIDARTGAGTLIRTTGYTSGNSIGHNGMTVDAAGRLLVSYNNAPGTALILRIDPGTGAGTPVASGIPGSIRGLATAPSGRIYSLHDGGPDQLYTLDLATSTATLVGPTGMTGLQALAFHNGVLYGWDCRHRPGDDQPCDRAGDRLPSAERQPAAMLAVGVR